MAGACSGRRKNVTIQPEHATSVNGFYDPLHPG